MGLRRLLPLLATLAGICLDATMARLASASDSKLIAYGRHLSGECATCHRPGSASVGIPSITGRDVQELIAAIGLYRSGERKNPAMVSVAQSLDDEQIKALATYFATLPKAQGVAKQ
jgi:cytochrome c553